MSEAEPKDLETLFLDYVRRPEYQPVKPRVIAKKLGLSEEDANRLKRVIKRLIQRGHVTWGAKHLVRCADTTSSNAAKSNKAGIVGVYSRAAGGYGFVRPRGT